MPEESLAVVLRDGGPTALSRVDVDGSEEPVVLEAALAPLLPTISPDRTTILYWSEETSAVRAIDPDGSDDRPFMDPAEGCSESQRPAWTADGERLAFACESSAGSRLLELDSSGVVVQELEATGAVTGSPTWAEVGDQQVVIYMTVTEEDGPTQLWWTDPDSGEGDQLVEEDAYLSHPDAADGQLLYVRKPDANPTTEGDLVITPLSLTGDLDTATDLTGVQSASWSPDASRIAYVSGNALWVSSPQDSGEPVPVPVEGRPGPPAWGSR
jgi:Tol biopolymer transport system component